MTKAENAEVTRLIELATEVGKARQKELFRCVDVLLNKAEAQRAIYDDEAADAYIEAAKAILQ